jgi:hypothetical protein
MEGLLTLLRLETTSSNAQKNAAGVGWVSHSLKTV